MNFSIIIPTYKREKDLKSCFFSIERQTLLPNEVLIIDDGGLDGGFVDDLRNKAGKLNIEFYCYKKNHDKEPRGTSVSRNIGVNLVKNEIFFILDDDLILDNDFFENIMKVWEESDEKLIGVGGIIKNNREKSKLEKIYNKIFFLDSKYSWDVNDAGFQVWDDFIEKAEKGFYVHGGVCSYKKSLVKDLQFLVFNTGRVALEDVDFCFRAKKSGFHFIVNPLARVIHNHSKGGREAEFESGKRESINRKIIFRNHSEKNIKNYFLFIINMKGWALRQLLSGKLKKFQGTIVGFFSK